MVQVDVLADPFVLFPEVVVLLFQIFSHNRHFFAKFTVLFLQVLVRLEQLLPNGGLVVADFCRILRE